MDFEKRFSYADGQLAGKVHLLTPEWKEGHAWRKGVLSVEGRRELELWASHSSATSQFIYLWSAPLDAALKQVFREFGLDRCLDSPLVLPGQLLLGAKRSEVVAEGIRACFAGPAMRDIWQRYEAAEIALFPVLREGMKYGMASAALSEGGKLCDEVVVDGHHTPDPSVPGLGRKMELSAFKDADLSSEERARVKVALLGDSVASGTVVVGLIQEIKSRFPNLERVELIAPLAAVYGLARIAAYALPEVPVRIHCFETVINALGPEYYFSPHYPEEASHIVPELEKEYREWWGKDTEGNWISDTACSGYGWSEAFFNPRKQLKMIDAELRARHGLTLKEFFAAKYNVK